MIRSNLLYATMIENDGRIGKQFTLLGSILSLIAAGIVGIILFQAVGYAIAVLK